MSASPWLPQLSWRTATAAILASLALITWRLGGELRARVPVEHVNGTAGFAITPPGGWTEREDDAEGSRIGPPEQPPQGLAWMVVTTRFVGGDSASMRLTEIMAREAGGPVRELHWGAARRFVLDDGEEALLAPFQQRMQGKELAGWTLLMVRDARMIQVSVVVPAYARTSWTPGIEASLRSLRLLR